MTSWRRQGVDSSPTPLGPCMGTFAWWSPALSWSRCVLHVLRVSAPACTAFNVPLFSFQIAVGFRASIQAGNLDALLRHLSSVESPSQMFVGDDFVFFWVSGPFLRVVFTCPHFEVLLCSLDHPQGSHGPSPKSHYCYHDACRRVHGHRYMLRASSAKQNAQRLC